MIHLVRHKSRGREGQEHLLFSFPAREGSCGRPSCRHSRDVCPQLGTSLVPKEIPAIERVQEQHRFHTKIAGSGFSEHS